MMRKMSGIADRADDADALRDAFFDSLRKTVVQIALLEIAAGAYEMTNLVYQGIDLVLDRERGPMLLELNARPGLNIQIANREGLASRLEAVEAYVAQHEGGFASIAERVAFARANFASRAV